MSLRITVNAKTHDPSSISVQRSFVAISPTDALRRMVMWMIAEGLTSLTPVDSDDVYSDVAYERRWHLTAYPEHDPQNVFGAVVHRGILQ